MKHEGMDKEVYKEKNFSLLSKFVLVVILQ